MHGRRQRRAASRVVNRACAGSAMVPETNQTTGTGREVITRPHVLWYTDTSLVGYRSLGADQI